MGERAEVRSIEGMADFRNALILYIQKVRPLLDDAVDEVSRTREWLRVEKRAYWENRVRQHRHELSEAQQALFSAELASLRAPSSAEVLAVATAKRAVAQAEEKLRMVKWLAGEFEREAQPRAKQIERLRSLTTVDLIKGVRHLEALIESLQRYKTVLPESISTGESTAPEEIKE